MWRWKEAVLGVGHDHFEAKPKTTRRIAEAVALYGTGMIDEVVVLANCARFEIYITSSCSAVDVAACAAAFLDDQVRSWQDRGGETGVGALVSFLDRPSLVTWPNESFSNGGVTADLSFQGSRIAAAASAVSGSASVANHLSLIAVGLPTGRALNTFTPFSSRDAHILLQLKRVLEFSSQNTSLSKVPPPCRARLGTLFRGALLAGKAARNSAIVPEIEALRFSLGATKRAAFVAAEAALKKAVHPAVVRVEAELLALDQGHAITVLRARANAVADAAVFDALKRLPKNAIANVVASAVGRELHAPTIALRNGALIDEVDVLARVAAAATAAAANAQAAYLVNLK
jgi:hypothetical protein